MAATTTLLTLALAATPALASAQAAPQPGQAPQAPAKSTHLRRRTIMRTAPTSSSKGPSSRAR
ncbi:hypothetical protein [Sphingomonas sp. Ant H11]|uniref:hypothetical protein n=1 Tax=Sphingomonas sp. Ant H11 TaxID=1564113 RepID=UPI00053DA709|nr:hypothetical protein [Sphingomonas sp. Ant H11]